MRTIARGDPPGRLVASRALSTRASDIRQRRVKAGLSQAELASRANCSVSMLGMLEGGYRPKRSAVAERIDVVLSDAERRKKGRAS